jgi:transposase InsO family protein
MECLNIDYVGPYDDGGSVLVLVDCFTRWVELYPTTDVTAATTAHHLLNHFGRFGAPSLLRSDRGPHFIADVIRNFLVMIGIEHQLTLAYSSEENAIVERQNKELNRHLRALIFDREIEGDYKTLLPFVQRIMNSSIHSRLQASPAQLLFGNAVNLDRSIFVPTEARVPQEQPLGPLIDNMLTQQQTLMEIASTRLLTQDNEHLAPGRPEPTHFPQGSFFLFFIYSN